MWKWRFSLTRLLMAVVFLAVFVGLNMREIGPKARYNGPTYYWGWPFPCVVEQSWRDLEETANRYLTESGMRESERARLHGKLRPMVQRSWEYKLPLTHQSYRLLKWDWTEGLTEQSKLVPFTIMNALFALIPLLLILFLQIPRRKVVAKVE